MTPTALDGILCLQLSVAWAGEGRCEPTRLGWWPTDLVDPAGGGDLFARLVPRTHEWAALQAVREAARRVDAKARKAMDAPDEIRTLFHLGFRLDERLSERLAKYKCSGFAPHKALPGLFDFGAVFNRDLLANWLIAGAEGVEYQVVPGGRELQGDIPAEMDALVTYLAAALVPLPDQYPMPFVRCALDEDIPSAPLPERVDPVTLGEIEALKALLRRDHAKRKRKGAQSTETCACGYDGPVDYGKVDAACSALKKLLCTEAAP